MLRTINPQLTLWESILPECCLGLPGDLAEIDRLPRVWRGKGLSAYAATL